jgi:hypothetical protein
MVYLIGWKDVEIIRERISITYGMWESTNCEYEIGCWITNDALMSIQKMGICPCVLVKANNLPIFYGPLNLTICKEHYDDALTAISLSKHDGSKIRGVSYLNPYGDYSFCQDIGRCFRYGYCDDPKHNWRVVGHYGDAEWLLGEWGNEFGFQDWLKSLDNLEKRKS